MSDTEHEQEAPADAETIGAMNATPDEGEQPGDDETPATPDEPDEDETADEPEQPAFEPPPGMTEKELEANQKKIDKARAGFYDRIGTIMGEDAQALVPCPACSYFVPGLIFPQELPDQVKAELWPFLGLPDPNEIAEAPDRHVCPTCKGRGQLKSGSLVPEYAIVNCRACLGRGYTDDVLPVQETNGANGTAAAVTLDQTPPMPEDEAWIQAARARGFTVVPPYIPQGS